MSEIKYGLICSECESSEVYYENATTGSGKYTCQDCGFMSLSVDDFKYAVPVKEFNDLRAKLKMAEKDIKRHKDIIHRQYLRGIDVIGKLEQARKERDELSEKNRQLESQVAVMHGALKKLHIDLRERSHNRWHWQVVNEALIAIKPTETSQRLQEQTKYAELGQLVMRVEVCWHNYKINDGDCHGERCSRYMFCQKRDELLAGEK